MNGAFKTWALFGGPLAATVVGLSLVAAGLPRQACWCGAITTLCAVWWISEAIPLPATSLIPFAFFPLTGVLKHDEVAQAYGHPVILLMLGGSVLSVAMEKSGAHRRLALGIVRLVGGRGGRPLVLGFVIASAVLSMWISNTATTLMLLPVAIAIIESSDSEGLAVPLLLAVAYGASVGGSGTPIGSPTNVIALRAYTAVSGEDIGFLSWMMIGLPIVVVMVPVVWLWLTRRFRGPAAVHLPKLGPWRPDECRVLVVLALTALAWMTRKEPFGGWGSLVGISGYVGDSTVALTSAVLLFVLPSGRGQGDRLVDWESVQRLPWGTFILLGGGLAIGQAFMASGLSTAVGGALAPLAAMPLVLTMVVLCLSATFLTEVTSNTAVANILMPILAATSQTSGIDPALLMAPATFGLNCAFMLPVATPPNAIMYGTGRITVARMAREGLALNLIGTAVITAVTYLLLKG